MKKIIKIYAISLIVFVSIASCASKQVKVSNTDKASIQVMVIGSEHFANPGRDLVNVESINVFSAKRQAELASLAVKLNRFKPSKVAIESQGEAPEYLELEYLDFKQSDLQEKANEAIQIGYRLAHLAGHENVYAIDEQPADGEPDYFPIQKLNQHLKATNQEQAFAQSIGQFKEKVNQFLKEHRSKPVSESLALLNAKSNPVNSFDFYLDLMKYDRGEQQPGAEIFAYYMMRNTKIASKLLNVAKAGDRVVIIYGAGHKAWLDFIFANMPGVELVDPVPYLQ